MEDKRKNRQFRELKKDIHKNACDHGWHDHKIPTLEAMVLLLAEVSEALEDYRSGKQVNEIWYEADGKPCGIPTELADVCIRLWDYQELIGYDDETAHPHNKTIRSYCNAIIDEGFTSAIGALSIEIVNTFYICRGQNKNVINILMNDSLIDTIVFQIAMKYDIDMWQVILEKHEYNKKRPYRHGEKVC